MTSFAGFGLNGAIARAIAEEKYLIPTPIQVQTILVVMSRRDVIGIAQTGTGKTAAFALPILQQLAADPRTPERKSCRVLVLSPTRELSGQIADCFRTYGRHVRISAALAIGGVSMGGQVRSLLHGVDVLVATPGRLLDLLEQRALSLQSDKILVLDEVDRMLDMGFLPDVRRIVEKIPTDRQTLLFSATLPPEIERLAAWVLRHPELVEIGARRSPAETVTHAVYPVAAEQKFDLLMALL